MDTITSDRLSHIFHAYVNARCNTDTTIHSIKDIIADIGVTAADVALMDEPTGHFDNTDEFESYIKLLYRQPVMARNEMVILAELAIFGARAMPGARYINIKIPGNQSWTNESWRALPHMARPHPLRPAPVQHIDGLDMSMVRHVAWTDIQQESTYSGLLVMMVGVKCKSSKMYLHGAVISADTCQDEYRMTGICLNSIDVPPGEIADDMTVCSVLLAPGQAATSPIFVHGLRYIICLN